MKTEIVHFYSDGKPSIVKLTHSIPVIKRETKQVIQGRQTAECIFETFLFIAKDGSFSYSHRGNRSII